VILGVIADIELAGEGNRCTCKLALVSVYDAVRLSPTDELVEVLGSTY
jgi:hypothetical protein